MSGWTAAQMPSQDGRRVVVTGANSGIGLVAARELARAGARVTLAVRDVGKGRAAAAGIPGDAVSSGAHRMGAMRWDDLQWQRGYKPWAAYGQSKLANLLFMFELQRRAGEAGAALRSVAAHPGYAATNLQRGTHSRVQELAMRVLNRVAAQSADAGALPTLYAATADLPGGTYVGPDGPGEMRGAPKVVGVSRAAADPETQRRLWQVSEELTGVSYAFGR